ncbi:hypothetical protein AAVH_18172 [Aphelenchoides avenae]|nr:hypothetical protein AAVH_18172 [Aphelenchus avenae]
MLPPAHFANVARCLQRSKLDRMLTLPPQITDGIRGASEPNDLDNAPRRTVTLSVMRDEDTGRLKISILADNDARRLTIATNEQLHEVMLNCYVRHLCFESMEPAVLNSLAPYAHRWLRGGVLIVHPTRFANADAFLRVFDILAVTEGAARIDFEEARLPFHVQPSRFWDTQLFHRVRSLEIISMPENLKVDTVDVARWLNDRPAALAADEKKSLYIYEEELREPVLALYGELRKIFLGATQPAPYTMRIRVHQPVFFSKVFHTLNHPSTGEQLVIQPEVEWNGDVMNPSSSYLIISRASVDALVLALEEMLRVRNMLPRILSMASLG